jgi:hypothetical protein
MMLLFSPTSPKYTVDPPFCTPAPPAKGKRTKHNRDNDTKAEEEENITRQCRAGIGSRAEKGKKTTIKSTRQMQKKKRRRKKKKKRRRRRKKKTQQGRTRQAHDEEKRDGTVTICQT